MWWYLIGSGWCCQHYSPENVEAGATDWNNLVGTGAFVMKEYVVGSHMSYARNPNFWRKTTINGKEYEIPFIDELFFPTIPDRSTQIAALRTGVLDIQMSVRSMYWDSLAETSPELLYAPVCSGSFMAISVRCDTGPTSNLEVRRAMMIAMDRKAILKAAYGEGDIISWPVDKTLACYTPIDELPASARELFDYDPAKAKQMVVDAGYPDGFKVEIMVRKRAGATEEDMASMVADMWSELGIDVTLNVQEEVAIFKAFREGTTKECVIWEGVPIKPMETLEANYVLGGRHNFGSYDNPYIKEQLDKALATIDADERNAILKEIVVIALEECAYLPLAMGYGRLYWWPWIKNYWGEQNRAITQAPFETMWLDQALKKEMGY